jgi:Fe-S-cluster containining protein
MNPCATCGKCCRSYVVPVCGYDVWWISTRQRLSPEQFVVAYPQKQSVRESFLLEPSGQQLGLALDKRGPFTIDRACIFLVELAGGNARCGIYADRPVVCQVYPMSLRQGLVSQRPDSLCPPDAWPAVELANPSWRLAAQRLRIRFDVYQEVVARWNGRVGMAEPGTSFVLAEFYSYLLNVYDRLAHLDARLGDVERAEIELTWGTVDRSVATQPRWVDYFVESRRVMDSFYPDVPPRREVVLQVDPINQPVTVD